MKGQAHTLAHPSRGLILYGPRRWLGLGLPLPPIRSPIGPIGPLDRRPPAPDLRQGFEQPLDPSEDGWAIGLAAFEQREPALRDLGRSQLGHGAAERGLREPQPFALEPDLRPGGAVRAETCLAFRPFRWVPWLPPRHLGGGCARRGRGRLV